MQLSQTLSSPIAHINVQTAIAQINVSKSLITNHTEMILLSAYSFFQFLYNLNINSLLIGFNGGASGSFFLPLVAVVVEERF